MRWRDEITTCMNTATRSKMTKENGHFLRRASSNKGYIQADNAPAAAADDDDDNGDDGDDDDVTGSATEFRKVKIFSENTDSTYFFGALAESTIRCLLIQWEEAT